MDVKNTQVQKGDIVDLTNAGLEEIKKYNLNVYKKRSSNAVNFQYYMQ